jgi:phosphatidylglycerophosphate synthase
MDAHLSPPAAFTFERCVKDRDVEEAIDLYLHRRLAFWLVLKPIEKFGLSRVTPMHLTLLSIVVGVGAGAVSAMAATRGPMMCVLGAALVLWHVMLDCADGMLARLRGGGSRLGMLVDGLGDGIVGVAYWAGVSKALAAQAHGAWLWPALLAILLSIVAHTAVYDSIKTKFTAATTPAQSANVAAAAAAQPTAGAFERFVEGVYAAYQGYATSVGKIDLDKPLPVIDVHQARAALRPAMRTISWIGLGSSLFTMYLSALLMPLWAHAPLWFGLVGIVGVGNVVMLLALRQLGQGERALLAPRA